MSAHNFADLFKKILFPLFVEDDREKFSNRNTDQFIGEGSQNEHGAIRRRRKTVRELAMDEFVRKFEDDHKSVQMLDPIDRIKLYRFNNRSV